MYTYFIISYLGTKLHKDILISLELLYNTTLDVSCTEHNTKLQKAVHLLHGINCAQLTMAVKFNINWHDCTIILLDLDLNSLLSLISPYAKIFFRGIGTSLWRIYIQLGFKLHQTMAFSLSVLHHQVTNN